MKLLLLKMHMPKTIIFEINIFSLKANILLGDLDTVGNWENMS